MRLVTALFVFLVLYFLLFSGGAFPVDPATVDPNFFLLGLALLVVVSFFTFQYEVWRKDALTGFQPQEVRARTSKTPYQVMREANKRLALIVGISTLAIILILEVMGYHDLLVQIWDVIVARASRLATALSAP